MLQGTDTIAGLPAKKRHYSRTSLAVPTVATHQDTVGRSGTVQLQTIRTLLQLSVKCTINFSAVDKQDMQVRGTCH